MESFAVMTNAPPLSGPPSGSNETAGRTSSRGEDAAHPAGSRLVLPDLSAGGWSAENRDADAPPMASTTGKIRYHLANIVGPSFGLRRHHRLPRLVHVHAHD